MSTVFHSTTDIAGYIYAGLIINGGVTGYVKKGSIASLVAGAGSGLIAGYGAYRVTHNPRDVKVSIAITAFLTLLMGVRFLRSGKFMPAGMVAIASLIMLLRYAMRLR